MDQFGSQGNREPLLLVDRDISQMKEQLFDANSTLETQDDFKKKLEKFAEEDLPGSQLFQTIRTVCNFFLLLFPF